MHQLNNTAGSFDFGSYAEGPFSEEQLGPLTQRAFYIWMFMIIGACSAYAVIMRLVQ